MSSSTRWGAKAANSSSTRVRSPARRASQPQEEMCAATAEAMASSSSTRKILYIYYLQIQLIKLERSLAAPLQRINGRIMRRMAYSSTPSVSSRP
jgi:hypothetical protein